MVSSKDKGLWVEEPPAKKGKKPKKQKRNEICRHWNSGRCDKGLRCKFRHDGYVPGSDAIHNPNAQRHDQAQDKHKLLPAKSEDTPRDEVLGVGMSSTQGIPTETKDQVTAGAPSDPVGQQAASKTTTAVTLGYPPRLHLPLRAVLEEITIIFLET